MQRNFLSTFPEDIWNNIENYLSTSDLIRLGLTSTTNLQSMYVAMARRIFADFSITQIEVVENKAVYFLASDGRVWHSDLEEKNSKKTPSFPALLIDLPPIKKMFNLWKYGAGVFIFLIDDNHDVWLCSNFNPLLNWANGGGKWTNWLSGSETSLTKPVKIKDLKNIKEISMYGDYIYFLEANGCVSRKGYLTASSTLVICAENIDHITDGAWNLFFIDKEGKVYDVGSMDYSIVEGPSQIVSITKGYKQHYFLDQDGKVWNQCRQNGTVRQFHNLPPVKQIITNDFWVNEPIEFVTYFIDHKDAVWVYGASEKGLLGLGEINQVTEPVKLEKLPPVKQIMSDGRQTIFLDTSKKTWLLGALDDVSQPRKKCTNPTLLEFLPPINYMEIRRNGAPNFIDEQGNLWVKYGDGSVNRYSLGKVKLKKIITGVGIDGGLFIDEDNALHFHDASISAINTPFNFAKKYIKRAMNSCHLTLNELIVLACSRHKRDGVFQYALITALSDENKATQFYYCVSILSLDSRQINTDIIPKLAALLFNPDLGNSNKQCILAFTQEDNKRYAVAKAFINLYFYHANQIKSGINKEYGNFILIPVKLAHGEISNVSELKNHITSAYNKIETWSIGYLNQPLSQYSSLCSKLLNAIGDNADLFEYLKTMSKGFEELFFEHLKENKCYEYHVTRDIAQQNAKENENQISLFATLPEEPNQTLRITL